MTVTRLITEAGGDAVAGSSLQVPPLYGRDDELEALQVALAAAAAGRGELAFVAGEAGFGKTALVEALAAGAHNAGAVVLTGHAYDHDAAPYAPWIELLRGYRGGAGLPDLSPGLASAEILEALAGKDAVFEQVAGFLASLSQERLVLLVLEDLHWSDQASLELLRSVARRVSAWPLLIVATFRERELAPHQPLQRVLPMLLREARPLRIDLRPLSDDAVRQLIGVRYGLPPPDEAKLTAYVQRATEGNALLLIELLRTLEHERLLCPADDGWQICDLSTTVVPPLVRHMLGQRVAGLDEDAQRLLQIAAVVGVVVPPNLWQAAAGVEDEAFADAIDAARRISLIDQTPDRAAFRFTHALCREALYDQVALPRRRAWHRRLAELLSEQERPDADLVAHHFLQGDDERAVAWLIRAGRRAEWQDAAWDAITRYEQALALLEPLGPSTTLALLHADLAEAYRYIDPLKSVAHLDAAEMLVQGSGDRVLMVALHWLRMRSRSFLGYDALAEMREVYAEFEQLSPPERERFAQLGGKLTMPTRAFMAQSMAFHGQYEEAMQHAEAVLADQPARSRNELAGAYIGLGLAHANLGRPEAARVAFAAAREHYRAVGSVYMVASTLKYEWLLVAQPYVTDDLAACQRLWDDYVQTMARLESFTVYRGSKPLLSLFDPSLLDGSWSEVRESALAYLDVPTWRLSALAALAELERRQGKRAAAWGHIRAGLPEGAATSIAHIYFVYGLALQRVAARLALDEGKTQEALPWIDAHEHWLDWSGRVLDRAASVLLRARYHLACGDGDMARSLAEQALQTASEPRQPLDLLAAHQFLGTLATENGQFAEAERHLTDALALADVCALPYEQALIGLDQIRLLAAQDRWEETLPLRRKCRTTLARLGAAPDLARLDELEAQSADGSLTVLPAGLSARQAEVLRLAAQGLSYAEIGERLFISPRTVARHLQSVYDKLGVTSRAEAAAFAFAHGLM